MKKIVLGIIAFVLATGITACSPPPPGSGLLDAADGSVEIRVFSNLPDRTGGQGLVEQMIFDDYMRKNPGITLSVETLDDEAYKIKFKAYASGSNMPDLVSVWGQPGFISEIIEAGLLEELDETDYADYGFIEGSLDGFRSADGGLYGLPRNTDVSGIYYNKALFDRYGWEVPATFGDLLVLCGQVRGAGFAPIAIDGADKWPLSIFYHDMLTKYCGRDTAALYTRAMNSCDFASDPAFLDMAALFQDSAALLFQSGFETQGYGTARDCFVSGQSAMYYAGSWNMSMAGDEGVAPDIRKNIRVFTMPPLTDSAKGAKDIAAWFGGGHSVTSAGKEKEEALKLLAFLYRPENWSRIAWENNICMSAQDFAQYKTGSETPVQLEFIDVVQNTASISGTPLNDCGTAQFKTQCENMLQSLTTSMITPGEFVAGLGK
ncbi:MAG: ABC transporter substrate-binding protein [Acetanaerobacterium sp.]